MTSVVEGRDSMIGNCAAEIVAAYVSNNHVAVSDLATLIESVGASLAQLDAQPSQSKPQPLPTSAEVRRSITPDALISFVDGKPYKALRRHLRFKGHTPESYRAQYGLPVNYPMVASSYSARRTEISKSISLGKHGRV